MRSRAAVALLALLLGAGCTESSFDPSTLACEGPQDDPSATHPRAEEYQRALDDLTRLAIPGAAYGVHDADGYWFGATGYADLASRTPARTCHRAHIASVTKTLVATAVLSLVEEGLFDLDDPIRTVLPAETLEGLPNADIITVRQLLNHTSGMGDYLEQLGLTFSMVNDPGRRWTPQECIDWVDGISLDEPGASWHYSNAGYQLLARILEHATSVEQEEVLRERVFEPAGLQSTSYHVGEDLPEGVVREYRDILGDGVLVDVSERFRSPCLGGAGGGVSNVYDLVTFIDALLRYRVVLSEDTLARMMEVVDTGTENSLFGLGLWLMRTDYGPAYGHFGETSGILLGMFYFPEEEVTLVWWFNRSFPSGDERIEETTFYTFPDVLFEE